MTVRITPEELLAAYASEQVERKVEGLKPWITHAPLCKSAPKYYMVGKAWEDKDADTCTCGLVTALKGSAAAVPTTPSGERGGAPCYGP